MAIQLFAEGDHECLMFNDLVDEGHEAVQSNQFMIRHGDKIAVIDPGGLMSYNAVFLERLKHFPNTQVEYIMASHADPDVVASLSRWMMQTNCRLVIPALWARFVPHFCSPSRASEHQRFIHVPDAGGLLPFGPSWIAALPAHFLHSEGNFQFYDPVSKILFSGDLGASMVSNRRAGRPVRDFDEHIARMRGFHRRYMNSRKACQFWAHMVRDLDIHMIVPQHGSYFHGEAMVKRFIDWVEQQECGLDLMTQKHYSLPTKTLG